MFIRSCIYFILAHCFLVSGLAGLRIATYNLDNYLVVDRRVGERWRPNYPKPENEKSVVRRVILKANPDILVLQEIGTVEFLEELRADLAAAGLHYNYAVHLDGPDTVRHVALLSKVSPVEAVKHTNLKFKYLNRRERVKRGMLEVSFEQPNGDIFKLFVVHLKSKYAEDKEDPKSQRRRTREAEACRDRIIERTFNLDINKFMVVGDFNDSPASSTLRRFYQRGNLQIGKLVPATDSSGEFWTYYYEKEAQYSLVDGFVVSEDLFSYIRGERGSIVDTPEALEGSDHRMVYLDLKAAKKD